MSRSLFAVLIPLAILSAACVTDASAPDGFDGDDPSADRQALAAGLCSNRVHVARRDGDAACPNLWPWQGKQLFDAGTPWLAGDAYPVPGVLKDYCTYTWGLGGAPSAADLGMLYGSPDLDAVAPSCRVAGPQTGIFSDALGPTLRDLFRGNVGRPSAEDIDLPATGTLEPVVTVMVVDSQPSNVTTIPKSRHGKHVGNVIKDIACPDDPDHCRVQVDFTVGLPRIAGGAVDYVNGGHVATRSDVAAAVYEGVRRWDVANSLRAEPTRLVINLSLGWERQIHGNLSDPSQAGVQAVLSAMEYASCRGALLVAAAGNAADYCGVDGPILPAAWEMRSAPNAARCADLGVPVIDGAGLYRPLVHAVGALDTDLAPLANGREVANPRLMAASTHMVAGDPMHGGLSGTSVGAAVASATAALVWSYRDELRADEVMDWVYAAGDPVGLSTADFSLGGGAPSLHQVHACAALNEACSDPLASCPFVLPLPCATSGATTTLADVAAELALLTPDYSTAQTPSYIDDSCLDTCGSPVEIRVEPGRPAYCPLVSVNPAEHLVNPTPGTIGCPTCGIQGASLWLAVHPYYEGAPILGVLVTLTDEHGVDHPYDLGPLSLSSMTYTEITLDSYSMPTADVVAGEITIKFNQQNSTTDKLIVL